ncbi:MAG: nucleoside deaminase [Erysipelothrix sp.]|nr:nucleoside deaminase [Erysipelothrix sp.]
MNNNEEKYMQKALEQAKMAYKLNEIPVGCVIVYKDTVIAQAHNLKETNQTATDHAEIIAINAASKHLNSWRLSECDLYVTLEPCAMCASAIVQSRIRKVVIGTLDNKDGAVISSKHIFENNHNHQLIVKTKVLEQKCKKIIEDFLKNKR